MDSAGAGPRIYRVRLAAISHGEAYAGACTKSAKRSFAARQHHASRLLECCAYREGARFGPLCLSTIGSTAYFSTIEIRLSLTIQTMRATGVFSATEHIGVARFRAADSMSGSI